MNLKAKAGSSSDGSARVGSGEPDPPLLFGLPVFTGGKPKGTYSFSMFFFLVATCLG